MDTILEVGIAVILFLQSLGAWLVGPMPFFSFLGSEQFYLLVAPTIIWCLDASLGLRMGLALMICTALSSILKLAMHGSRPYWMDSRVQAFAAERSFGVPSGHAQNAVVVWGLLAAWIKRPWAWIAACALIFFIGLSRMVLGVHFPHDVLVGWLFGALILWAFLAWEGRVTAWLRHMPPAGQVLAGLGASLAILLLGGAARLASGGWQVPPAWIEIAARATPGADPINPLEITDLFSKAGGFFGLACGGVLLHARGWYDARGAPLQLAGRFALGIVGVLVLYSGLGAIFPDGESLLPYLLRYLRYALVGFWMVGLAPILFIRIGLAKPKADNSDRDLPR